MVKSRTSPGNPRIPVVKTVPKFKPTVAKIPRLSNKLLIIKIKILPDKLRNIKFKIICEFDFTANTNSTILQTIIIKKAP